MKSQTAYRPGIHAVALFVAAFTLPLLYMGGSVTTYRVGQAVPDWPTTFQENMFTYNFWDAPFGVKVEHLHRLYGAAVGMATIVLTACLMAFEPRRWMKGLGVFALAAVIGQGILGGQRVNLVSTAYAALHGCTGQAFFGLLVALCVFTGRDWNSDAGRAVDRRGFRLWSSLALALVYAQILAGGWLRHFATSLALWIHSTLAAAVLIYSGWLAIRIRSFRAEVPRLVAPSRVLIAAVTVQVLLGIGALVLLWPLDGTARPVPALQAVVRTGHQTNAAILFAASIVLTLRAFRHLAGTADLAAAWPGDRLVGRPEPAALDWEAVA
jgi:cytochrome c oxidase assembly protein subunit 15